MSPGDEVGGNVGPNDGGVQGVEACFTPRIRDITGIRIHQLTLPQSLPFASKLIPADQESSREATFGALGESSRLTRSPESTSSFALRPENTVSSTPSRRERRESSSTLPEGRERSPSTSILRLPPPSLRSLRSPTKSRSFDRDKRRSRSQTLAGEAIENEHGHPTTDGVEDGTGSGLWPSVMEEEENSGIRRLARCFITLSLPEDTETSVPFYISPIHRPSTSPSFLYLTQYNDLAPWLSNAAAGLTTMLLDVWYEDLSEGSSPTWRKFDSLSKVVDFRKLRKVKSGAKLPPFTLEIAFSSDPANRYCLNLLASDAGEELNTEITSSPAKKDRRQSVRGMIERSMRETRMKRGVQISELHHLVKLQASCSETEIKIAEIQRKITQLLRDDTDLRGIRRDVSERGNKCSWLIDKTQEVDKVTEEAHARLTLRKQAIDRRRASLIKAEERTHVLQGQSFELRSALDDIDAERSSMLPLIQHWRTHHAQTLDSLFPILPLHPPTLLYSILEVPLPIPSTPKDPAPPLSVPASILPAGVAKVDERTISAALGYAAMVVQILGHLSTSSSASIYGGTGSSAGSLPYPITCAGSRSLVKDVVSIMQGTRSFPLFAKGVERYRYEYAVFLLNKNIDMLMQEADVRPLDIRHTLPNLKNLLLTLSSPVPIKRPSLISRTTSTYVDSRSTSRTTSYTFPKHSQVGLTSPGNSSVDGPTSSMMHNPNVGIVD